MPPRDLEATARLVALAMVKLGLPPGEPGAPGKLAKIIGMPPYSEGNVGLVRRWLRGDHSPSAHYMVEILSQAGLLNPEADRAWKGDPADPAATARAAVEASEALRPEDPEERERRDRRTG